MYSHEIIQINNAKSYMLATTEGSSGSTSGSASDPAVDADCATQRWTRP